MVAPAAVRTPVLSSSGVSAWTFTNTSHGQVGLFIWDVKREDVNYFDAAIEQSHPTFMGRDHWELPKGEKVPLWMLVIMV